MTKRSTTALLLVCAAAVACGSENFDPVNGPEPTEFSLLQVVPAQFGLATVAPGNTVQLTVRAYDRAGALMEGTDAVIYSSSAPGVAEVSGSGLVTGAAPGTAAITAALTLGGITRTASTTVAVYDRDFSDLAGVYELDALITNADGWGYEGYRYTAVLTLAADPGPPGLAGTYRDLWFVGPGSDSSEVASAGVVTLSIDVSGRAVVKLLGDGDHVWVTLTVDTVAPGFIDGMLGCCDNFAGTFTAERR